MPRRRIGLALVLTALLIGACSSDDESDVTTTTGSSGTAGPATTSAPDPIAEITDAVLHINVFEAGDVAFSYEVEVQVTAESDPGRNDFQVTVDGAALPLDSNEVEPSGDGAWALSLRGDFDGEPPLGVYGVTGPGSSFEIGTLLDVPSGAPSLTSPADGAELTSVPDFVWTQHIATYGGTDHMPVEHELNLELVGSGTATLHPVSGDATAASLDDPAWTDLDLPLEAGDYLVTLHSVHQVDDRVTFEFHRISGFVLLDDPCSLPASVDGPFSVTDFEQGGRPRAIACGPDGVWIHTPESVRYGSGGPIENIGEFGEPSGNRDLVVFHTFNTVDYITATQRTPQRVLDRPDSDFIGSAVPFGSDRVLVSTVSEITLVALDGTVVWSTPASAQGRFAAGDDYWWAGDSGGRLIRIPLDGSDPTTFDVPDTIEPVDASRRDGLSIVPVAGGVWIDNGDSTIQFVSTDGELGDTVDVGPLFVDDGFHFVLARDMWVAGGVLYATDNNQQAWAVPLDDPGAVSQVDRAPFAEVGGLLWYLDDGQIVAEDLAGSQVFTAATSNGGIWEWEWGHGAIWITDQFGWVTRIGVGS